MTDLAGPAVGPAVDEAVDDQPHADAAADRHDEQVRKPAAGSEQLLGDGEGVDVVVEQDRQAQTGLQQADEIEVRPFEQRASPRRGRSPGSTMPGTPIPIPSRRSRLDPRGLEDVR